MDGLERRLNPSIQRKLSFSLSLAILLVASIAGVFSFMSAFDEAHELQDDLLRQIAQLVDRQRLTPVPPGAQAAAGGDEESRVIVQKLGAGNLPAQGVIAAGTLPLPATLADGLHTQEVGGERFRILVKTTAAGERIAVAQEASFRNEIARDSALRTVMPFLILVPILVLVVADLVRKMFRPIAALSIAIDQRTERDLHPVEAGRLPSEVRPFVVAINRLLARVDQSMQSQRRFVADAAHELRSPMTALSLQAERLAEADMSSAARERLTVLRRGIERGRVLLDQLLTLARAQSPAVQAPASISVQGIYRRVLEDLMPLAEAKRIDIGVETPQDATVWAHEGDITALVRNLVDNAIRYTPDGGRVDLSVETETGGTVLRIRDTGPGVPVAERERVFDPFYRALGSDEIGSGLGLSIVRAVAERIGARIRLSFTNEARHTGLDVAIVIPGASAAGMSPPG